MLTYTVEMRAHTQDTIDCAVQRARQHTLYTKHKTKRSTSVVELGTHAHPRVVVVAGVEHVLLLADQVARVDVEELDPRALGGEQVDDAVPVLLVQATLLVGGGDAQDDRVALGDGLAQGQRLEGELGLEECLHLQRMQCIGGRE